MSNTERERYEEKIFEASQEYEDSAEDFASWVLKMDGQNAFRQFCEENEITERLGTMSDEKFREFFEYVINTPKHNNSWSEWYCEQFDYDAEKADRQLDEEQDR